MSTGPILNRHHMGSTPGFDFGLPHFPTSVPKPRMDIHLLREALRTLDIQMSSLSLQRDDIELRLVEAARLEVPIWRLHRELLAAIFLIGVSGQDVIVSTLMLVCRHWKEVAVDTALLWTDIQIDAHHKLDAARRKLALSKTAPLYIAIDFNPREERGNTQMEDVVHSMDLIRPALWRTKSLRLSVPNKPHAHACAVRLREEAPQLETFSFRVYHSMTDEYTAYPLPLFNKVTPRLTSCSLTSYNFGWNLTMLGSLRVLKLGGYWNGHAPSMEVTYAILRLCPQLEELVLRNISDIEPDEYEEQVIPTIHLPRLKKALFEHTGLMRTHMLLSKISFPALTELEFMYFGDLTRILRRLQVQALTSLPLRHFHIESCTFNESVFVTLLARLRSITALEFVDIEDVSSHFLRMLSTPAASQVWSCPKLESLSIDGCSSLDWDSLRNFIESRLPPNPQPLYPKLNGVTSSASAAAEAYARSRPTSINSQLALVKPRCLRAIDVTRCTQISREMIQWLSLYIPEVRAEPGRGVWGESS